MSIKIIKPGILTTIQDTGRTGFRNMGIGSSGAMDSFAIQVANYLTGNNATEAVLEINFPAPEILFLQNAVISLTGAHFTPIINAEKVPLWTTLFVKKGSILQCKQPVNGTKLYLAVQGGWQAEKWLNSFSTNLKAAAGGFFGSALKKDDNIDFTATTLSLDENKIFPWHISHLELDKIYSPQNNIRCTEGVEWNLLNDLSKQNFTGNDFIISHQSNRMGYRLNNQPLLLKHPTELISSAVDIGTVQLLKDGNCIILMADHQTTGGYPRIASVIKADIPKLAQAKPGQALSFKMISIQEAEDVLISMQQTLEEIKKACFLNLSKIKNH